MTIIQEPGQPVELTEEQKLAQHVEYIKQFNAIIYKNLKTQHEQVYNLVWSSEQAPQDILDGFGTDAYKLFELSSKIQEILVSVDPTYHVITPPVPVVINEDGTVEVN